MSDFRCRNFQLKNIRFCVEGGKSEMEHPKPEIIKNLKCYLASTY